MVGKNRQTSFGKRVTWTVLIANAIGVTAACAVLMHFGARRELAAEMRLLAELVGMQSVIALALDDVDQANTALLAATSKDRLQSAIVYDETGVPFAQFRRDYGSQAPPAQAPAPGEAFRAGFYELTVPIVAGSQNIGSVYIRISAENVWSERLDDAALAFFAALISCVSTLIGLRLLLRRLVGPLAEMADRAERWSQGDLSGEPLAVADQELAVLADGFNQMAEHLRGLARSVVDESVGIFDLTHDVDSASAQIDARFELQSTSVESAGTVLAALRAGHEEVRAAIGALAPSSAEAASSVGQIQAAAQSAGEKSIELSQLVGAMSTAQLQASAAVRQIAEDARAQSGSSERAVEATTGLREFVEHATTRAHEGLDLSRRPAEHASHGTEVVQLAADSIRNVDGHFDKIRNVVDALGASTSISDSMQHAEGIGVERLQSMKWQDTACERIVHSVVEIDAQNQQIHGVAQQHAHQEDEMAAAIEVFQAGTIASHAEAVELRSYVSSLVERAQSLREATQAFDVGNPE